MIWAFHHLFESGIFQSSEVRHALFVGGVVAAVSAMIGVFVVIRGQSFVGHVLTDVGAAGASGTFLLGLSAWYGFLSFGLLAGTGVELLGDRAKNRDVATGFILSFVMGLGALFLYLDSTLTNNANASMLVLFGSVFVIEPSIIPVICAIGFISLIVLGILFRPLLLSSISPEVARARGVPVRFVGIVFMLLLAVAVESSALVVGALLSTALLIGPAATAIRMTSRIGWALFTATVVGVLSTWLGIVLAYDSYYWSPLERGWPVSFFVSALILASYLLSSIREWAKKSRRAISRRSESRGHLAV